MRDLEEASINYNSNIVKTNILGRVCNENLKKKHFLDSVLMKILMA